MRNSNNKIKILGRLGSLLSAGVLITAPIILNETLANQPSVDEQATSSTGPSSSTSENPTVENAQLPTGESQPATAVDDTFLIPYPTGDGYLQYTVLSENPIKKTGEIAVSGYEGVQPYGDLRIPSVINNNGFQYTVTAINDNVFNGCSGLTSVTIGTVGSNKPIAIGDYAFSMCNNLTSVTILSTTSIGGAAFFWCTSLVNISLPNTLEKIGSSAFANCTKLESISLPPTLTTIEIDAFSDCDLINIVIPDSVTSIGSNAFEMNKIKKVYMPQTPPTMGSTIFGTTIFGNEENDPKMYLASNDSIAKYNALSKQYWPDIYRTYTVKLPAEPVALTIVGDTLIELTYGTTTNKIYFATNNPTDSKYVNPSWGITTENKKITMNEQTGVLSIPNDLAVGTHKIKIMVAAPASKVLVATKEVVIIVRGVGVNSINVAGQNQISRYVDSEAKNYEYTAQVLPANATNRKLVWSLTGETADDKITIDPTTGVVSINSGIPINAYNFNVIATSTDGTPVSGSLKVQLNVIHSESEKIVIDGPTNLSTTFGTPITQIYTAAVYPASASQTVEWFCSSSFAFITINKNTGELSVPNNLPVRKGWIHVQAKQNELLTTFEIKVEVTKPTTGEITINGSEFIQTQYGKYVQQAYTTSFTPTEATALVKWSIVDNPLPDKIKILPTGVLAVSADTPKGVYYCEIVATSVNDSKISGSKMISINVTDPLATSITINGDSTIVTSMGSSATSVYAANIYPIQASQTVRWSLQDDSTNGKLSIDSNGKLMVANDIKKGTYRCSINATSTDGSAKSTDKNVTVEVITPVAKTVSITGESLITTSFGTVINQKYTATINPSGASQTVAWNLTNLSPGNQATIDPTTGVVNVPVDQSVGEYTCTVNCNSQDGTNISASYDITIIISTPLAVNIVISGTHVIKTTFGTAASSTYSAKITPMQASQNVKWSIAGDTAEGKITIDSFGKVSVANNTPIKDYSLIITATTMDGSNQKATSDLVVSVATSDATDVTISGKDEIITPYGTLANTTYKAQVDPIGSSQAVIWSVTGNTANGKIYIDSLTGNLTVADNTPMGTYVCTVVVTSSGDIQKQGTQTIVVTVSSPPVEKVEIIGPSEINVTAGKGGSQQYTASIAPVEASHEVKWTAYSLDTLLQGHVNVTSDGKLIISKDLADTGDFTAQLVCYKDNQYHPLASKNIIIRCKPETPAKIVINGNENIVTQQGLKVSQQYRAVVGPVGSSQSINWSLKGDTAGNQIKINPTNGLLSIPADIQTGTYTCYVVATANNVSLNELKEVTIYVAKPIATSIEIKGENLINAVNTQASSTPYKATVNPTDASQNVIWTLTGNTANGHITIDSAGNLLTQPGIEIGSYQLSIVAKTTGMVNVTANKDITVNIVSSSPEKIEIIGDDVINTTYGVDSSRDYRAKIASITPVTWTINGEVARGKIDINTSGQLTVAADTPAGEYIVFVTATAADNSNLQTTKKILINVIDTTVPETPPKDETLTIVIIASVTGAVLVGAATIAATVVSLNKHKKIGA